LGQSLQPALGKLGVIVAPSLEAFDLRRPTTVWEAVDGVRPDMVMHLAAETRVDYCEEHPEESFAVNARGTTHLAMACRKVGARVVMMSSDYVFDGSQRTPYREYQSTAPLNVYGRSKQEAERAVLTLLPDSLIVRSSSLFGEGGRHFAASILEAARSGKSLRVVDDQIQSPTWVGHLVPALVQVVSADLRGIVHLTASGSCSWYEFARAILDVAGIEAVCEPISSEESARPARRPAYSVLSCELAEETIGVRLPDWSEGLDAYLGGGAA
jgi:dTDP-4-dehydrorhamnose reductase